LCDDPDAACATASAAEQLEKNRDFLQLETWVIPGLDGLSDAGITVGDLLPDLTNSHQTIPRFVYDQSTVICDWPFKSNTHRRRDSAVELSRVGVSCVYFALVKQLHYGAGISL